MQGLYRKREPSEIQPHDFFETGDTVRARFARLIHAPDPKSIALIPAASYGIAIVAHNTPIGPGQNVVVLHEQFPSNVYTWVRYCENHRASLRTIDPPAEGGDRGARWNQRILEAIDGQTALVALPHVHWADGTLFDLDRIGQRAREVGAAFVIDGTQSVGALSLDVQQIQPDALICAGYKWLLGHYGMGVAYFGPRYLDGIPLEENWINRAGSENFSGLVRYEPTYQPGAIRYDVGERSNFILTSMLAAGLGHVLEWGVDQIQAYCAELITPFIDEFRALGCQIENKAWRADHLFGIRVPASITIEQVKEAVKAHQVSVSIRGNAVRVSPHVYNTVEDVAALYEALATCLSQHAVTLS